MKKLIAILFAFTLLTGAAFAQVDFSAELWAAANLMFGDTEDPDFPFAKSGQDGDPAFGGSLAFSYTTSGGEAGIAGKLEIDGNTTGNFFVDGSAFWFPIPQIKIDIKDANFDWGDPTPWNYLDGSGNWVGISIIPMDMLTIRFSVIEGDGRDGLEETAKYQFGDVFMAQVLFNIPNDFGKIGLTYDNRYERGVMGNDFVGRAIVFDFKGTFIEGLTVDLGFSFLIGDKDIYVFDTSIWGIGLKVGYNFAFGLGAELYYNVHGLTVDVPSWEFAPVMNLGFSVNYTIPINPFSLKLSAGMDIANLSSADEMGNAQPGTENSGGPEPVIGWDFGLELSRSIDGFTFTFGVELSDGDVKTDGLKLSVPVKFSYSW